ncbi:DUF6265 family protein [Ulvibacterium marinum]|uniref:DUF6265 family protein n=1 Tax=Ulvibacterium marinum TaxID=2419782 RepID=UPI0024940CFA|nr:DUF6265 family protein [Ulvibacterium marinum]
MRDYIIILLFSTLFCSGQNTLPFPENGTSPKASLQDVSWMEGHWRGEAFGGITEEFWSPPLGGSMMFVFKLILDGKVNFYEVGHIQQIGETLLLQLKHFHGNLKGWEEKDDTVDFKLVKVEGNRVFFDGFTFEKISDDEVNLYVVISQDNKTEKEVKFNYKRM